MNFTSRFNSISTHLLRHVQQFPKPFAITRNKLSHISKPFIFDGRGIEREKCLASVAVDNYCTQSCNYLDVWRNQILSVGFHTTAGNLHGEYEWQDPKSEDEVVHVQILDKDGKINTVRGKIGDNLLYLAKRFEVEMEGACEASLACTTCHVYVDHEFLDLLPEATETEEDLLDQAPFLKENSRLGCQIILNKQLNGIKLALPAVTKNFYVDGHKPTPH